MIKAKGTYATANGSKYLQQLCKHFAHKIDVEFTETDGTCTFPFGTAVLNATDAGLTVECDLEKAEQVEMFHNVIDKHLAKFAFRENFEAMTWS
ncbi:DUF2218 domain-containing protein [Celeribacter sp.]|uniref:DUF2218 domain-containing protein n=1 Tax=Celeribacter sp. TaxID=1890673 RepID=UPI003A9163F8